MPTQGKFHADAPMPEVTVGLAALTRDNPWPELPDIPPFYLSLDAGGRHLIADVIREHGITLMLEVGSFLCGSTRQWLEASPELTVIGVDPWDGNWSLYVRTRAGEGNRMFDDVRDPEALADLIQRFGNFCTALNNIREFRGRFIPVRLRSPEALKYLHRRKIEPELIYIDALKAEDDLRVAHHLFPHAILCGDDWTWRDEDGRYRMREHVESLADDFGYGIRHEGATWMLLREEAPWDGVSVSGLLDEISDRSREMLGLIVRSLRAGKQPIVGEIADVMDEPIDVLLYAIHEINEARASRRHPQPIGTGGAPAQGWANIGHRTFVLGNGIQDSFPVRAGRLRRLLGQ